MFVILLSGIFFAFAAKVFDPVDVKVKHLTEVDEFAHRHLARIAEVPAQGVQRHIQLFSEGVLLLALAGNLSVDLVKPMLHVCLF